jgi:hypothetical protein
MIEAMRVLYLLMKNARKTVAVSSAPPKNRRNFFAIWRRASAPCALLATTLLANPARPDATAADVVEAVTTGVSMKTDDAVIAAELNGLKLRERLTDDVVGFLSAQGIGPESLKQLEQLAKKSSRLHAAAATPVSREPVPDSAEFQRMLGAVGQYVAHYVQRLPNFTCDEITQRFTNFFNNPMQQYFDPVHFRHVDTLHCGLRFTGGHDRVTLVAVNGKSMKRLTLSTGESISTGAFGDDMGMVMGPTAASIVQWSRWQALAGRRAAVSSGEFGCEDRLGHAGVYEWGQSE